MGSFWGGAILNDQPLSGLVVLDFGQVYNGPYCGFLLAQAGARVIKVESLRGETLRGKGKSTASYPFAILNSNKECIAINIKTAEGQTLIKKLAKVVDVVLENFAPGTMDKHGIGAEVLRKENPRLIYASSTGYGEIGPYRDFLGMDITLQAMAGVMTITGEDKGPPMKTAAASIDFLAGTHMYGAILSALYAREKSEEGSRIDISMQDCVYPTLATALGAYYDNDKVQRPRAGNRHPGESLAPYNVYETADGHVAIICIREGHWKKLCGAMKRPELAEDARFVSSAERSSRIDEVDSIVTEWTSQHSKEYIFSECQKHRVICAPVKNLDDVVNDPHLHARGTLVQTDHPELGEIAQTQTPIRFSGIDPPPIRALRSLGQDTEKVLHELVGVDENDFRYLQSIEAVF